jgi:hypothetical protein
MIHVIGDSHVCFFNGVDGIATQYPENELFKTYRLGAPIAYNLSKFNTMYKAREQIAKILPKISLKDSLLFCFGEIDCRYHIKNQSIKQNKNINEIIIDCVNRYVNAIKELNILNHKVGVWGPIASTYLEEICSSKDCWIKGSPLERNIISLIFNDCLQKKCKEENIHFISIFKDLILPNNNTNTNYYMDAIHLSQKAMPLITHLFKDGEFNDAF